VIEAISAEQTTLSVKLSQEPPAKLPLRIVLALPRPKMIRRIFRTVAELGVEELIIINSYKVEKSYWQSPVLSSDNIREYFVDGLQQAKDTVLPKLRFEKRFKPFVEDDLPTLITGQQALLAHPNQGQACPQPLDQRATLAIGPEGGFTEYEAAKLIEAGFSGIHLGSRILKVETALTSLIAKLYR
jgi:RsmE family RNA methyltransferase